MTRAQNTSEDEVKNLLATLRDVPSRDPGVVQEKRAAFLDSLETLPQPVSPQRFWRLNLRSAVFTLRLRTLTIAILLVSLFGGGTYTVSAAQASLPGEGLYPVKIWVEHLRTALTFDTLSKLRLHLDFASERLDEIVELESRGILDIPQEVYDDFNYHIAEANLLLPSNPKIGTEIKGLISRFTELEKQDEDLEEVEESDPADDHSQGDQEDDADDGVHSETEEEENDTSNESSNDDSEETDDPDENDRDLDPSSTPDDDEEDRDDGSYQHPEETDESDEED